MYEVRNHGPHSKNTSLVWNMLCIEGRWGGCKLLPETLKTKGKDQTTKSSTYSEFRFPPYFHYLCEPGDKSSIFE